MKGLGRRLEGAADACERVESVLDAIEFQTAMLTLNAAVEAAHSAEPAAESTAPNGRVRKLPEPLAATIAESAHSTRAEPSLSGTFVRVTAPNGSTPQTDAHSERLKAESPVEARIWQVSLERLRQSLAVAGGGALPVGAGGRAPADEVCPQQTLAREPVPAPHRRGRPQPTQFSRRRPLESGAERGRNPPGP